MSTVPGLGLAMPQMTILCPSRLMTTADPETPISIHYKEYLIEGILESLVLNKKNVFNEKL